MQSVEALQQTFSVEGVRFYRQDGLVMVEVRNAAANALLTTHGASVLSFTPLSEATSQQDWLWVSESAVYNGESRSVAVFRFAGRGLGRPINRGYRPTGSCVTKSGSWHRFPPCRRHKPSWC